MKISYNWLSQYLPEIPEPDTLAVWLTDCGLEVEMVEEFASVPGGLKGVVIGQVATCLKHPNADKLSLTSVDIGMENKLSIVCGAPNVAAGQKVLVATIGTMVNTPKGSFVIEKTKIRGEVSEGMICAEDELGLGTSHDGILVLPDDVQIGMPAATYFNIETDYVLEIGLTPNRNDATSHMGVARDVIALLNLKRMDEHKETLTLKFPSTDIFKVDDNSREIPVTIEDEDACPRYSGITISGIKVGESPAWLQNKLKAVDIRPINNIVDITNFVLMECGQPLHAFDADAITGGRVIVRKLPEGTVFKTLDEIERKLNGRELMICNELEGMCMAGVFGGMNSGVTEKTNTVFLESACFDPVTTRMTSKAHGLKTDAAFRFERGTDINITVFALKRAAMLIKEIAGGNISSGIVDVCPGNTGRKQIKLSLKRLDQVAGKHIDREVAVNVLSSLDFEIVKDDQESIEMTIPTAKADVTREIDVIEEVLRIYGYNNIELPVNMRTSISYRKQPDNETYTNAVANMLTSLGYYEMMNNSMTSADYYTEIEGAPSPAENACVMNPISRELNVMRQTLLFGGLEVISYNRNRKNADIRCYEFGKTYRHNKEKNQQGLEAYAERSMLALFMAGDATPENWKLKSRKADIFDLKHSVEGIFNRLGIDRASLNLKFDGNSMLTDQLNYYSGKEWLCTLGSVKQGVLKYFDLKDEVYYAEIHWEVLMNLMANREILYREVPRFPVVRRDLALLIDHQVSWEQIEKLAYETAAEILQSVNLFDVYRDEKLGDRRSYAISFTLQNTEKTMTDKEIELVMTRLLSAFKKKLGAELRS